MTVSPRIIEIDETDSTNDEVRRLAQAGEPPPFWVRARRQTKGRGRRGRTWVGYEGNLFLSGLFHLAGSTAEAAQLSFAAALAVTDALDVHVSPTRLAFKWPNDVKLDGAKVAGVLLEASERGRGLELVVGIGVNLARAPEAAPIRATALATALRGDPPSADQIGRAVAAAFEAWRERWARGGFASLRSAWLARAEGLGDRVVAQVGQERLEGVFEDLDEQGALILATPGGRRLVRSGEVFFATPSPASPLEPDP
jgi:BirA family biotin operon repressor/biotin-[acetyl-CoA-carboxylase] ligase